MERAKRNGSRMMVCSACWSLGWFYGSLIEEAKEVGENGRIWTTTAAVEGKDVFFILQEGHKDSEKEEEKEEEEEESESSVYEDTLVFDTSVLILMLLSSLGHRSLLGPSPTSSYGNRRPSKPSKRTGRHSWASMLSGLSLTLSGQALFFLRQNRLLPMGWEL